MIEVPADELRSRLGRLLGRPVADLRRLPGGASGLTYLLSGGGASLVAKVAPAGIPAVGNRDVLRQSGMLRLLAAVEGLRVPEVVVEDPGQDAEHPPLFVMSYVEGESVEPLQEPGWTATRAEMAGRAHAAVEMLAAMHTNASVPEDEPTSLDGEVLRWDRAFASVPSELNAGADSCRDGLLATLPEPLAPTIVHGDWRLGNMLCVGSMIAAVIDWEIWTVGDPRCDLAWLLLAMDVDHPHATVDPKGLPTPGRLLAAYQEARGPMPDMSWFAALERYKQAAIIALLVKNARKGDPAHPFSVTFTPVIGRLLEWSARLLVEQR